MIISKLCILSILLLSTAAMADTIEYQVPSTDQALAALSKFQIEFQCAQAADGTLKIKYAYPQELTGVPVEINMQQSRFDSTYYFGDAGEMKCANSACAVHYTNLPFDEPSLNSHLKQISLDENEFTKRLQVALNNHGDPGGTFNETPTEYCKDLPK